LFNALLGYAPAMRPAWLPKAYLRVCELAVLGILVVTGTVWLLVVMAEVLARLA
jgi:hypothetical protein